MDIEVLGYKYGGKLMLYLSLGSQPVVSSVLKDCNLNTNQYLIM